MGLFGGGDNNGLFFLVIVVVLAFAVVFMARGGEIPSVPSFDFNTSGASSILKIGDSNSNGQDTTLALFGIGANSGGNDANVSAYFCPQDGCADRLIEKIDSANQSIYVAIYSFTHDGIADALIRAKQRGVDVKVIFDYDQSKIKESDDEKLAAAGIGVVLKNGEGYMHNKFAVIDGQTVATGSFNYSGNADTKNEENLVFIQSPRIAAEYKADFDAIWASSQQEN